MYFLFSEIKYSYEKLAHSELILGRWSSKSQQFQQQYISTQSFEQTHKNHGIGCVSNFIRLTWEKCQDEWHTRNKARHAQGAEAKQQIHLATAQHQIQALYKLKDSCFYHGRTTYFKASLDIHFAQVTQVHHLQNWITTY
jgi:hypothetical protein